MFHEIVTNPDVQAGIQVLILALATAAGGVLTKAAAGFVKANVSVRNLELLQQAAGMAVLYAEQTGLAKTGDEKLSIAYHTADAFLSAHGINVTSLQLRTAIEAAVHDELNRYGKAEPLVAVTTTAP